MCVDFRKNYDAEITTQESTEGVPYLGKEPDYSRYHPQHWDVPGCLPLPSYTDIRHQVTGRQACVGRPLYFHINDSSFCTL